MYTVGFWTSPAGWRLLERVFVAVMFLDFSGIP